MSVAIDLKSQTALLQIPHHFLSRFCYSSPPMFKLDGPSTVLAFPEEVYGYKYVLLGFCWVQLLWIRRGR
ncbi:hypothetical protein V2J09_009523 [Rumex salicifolius]